MKLLSLPYVIINELMTHLEPVELINLSFSSKRAYAFVKTYSKVEEELEIKSINSWQYSLRFREQLLIAVISEEDMAIMNQNPKHNSCFKLWATSHGHVCAASDIVMGCKESANHICDLFKIPVSIVISFNEENIWLPDFIQQRQKEKLKKIRIYHDIASKISAVDYTKILSFNGVEFLNLVSIPPKDYRFYGKLAPFKRIFINDGIWITLKNVLKLESEYVELYHTFLTSSDITALLKSWLKGGLSKLKYLVLEGVGINDTIYDSVHNKLERVKEKIAYGWDNARVEVEVEFNTDAFHIRREDDVVAAIKIEEDSFVMAVWPDVNGKRV